MITWMQRHKKYLVITIWISTIAFIGAGFVGWGQYSYGDKASSVAKVGEISITANELQRAYSNLFNQYNQLFQGKLDEKQAQQFGLQKQAMQQLVHQALILNLAKSYNLDITDAELLQVIQSEPAFGKNGVFNKETYATTLKQNGFTIKDYESLMKKELLIQKTLYLIGSKMHDSEFNALKKAVAVSDKIDFQVIKPENLNISIDDQKLKSFWENHKTEYMTQAQYDVSYVELPVTTKTFSPKEIEEYYKSNKLIFKDSTGKLLSLKESEPKIVSALNESISEKNALKLYIDFKKGKIPSDISVKNKVFTLKESPFSTEITKEISTLDDKKSFMKPKKVANSFIIIKLNKSTPPKVMSFEEAKQNVLVSYSFELKKEKAKELAKTTYSNFNGTKTDFFSRSSQPNLLGLSPSDVSEFISKLFLSKNRKGYIILASGNVIIYNVLDQKISDQAIPVDPNMIAKLKAAVLEQQLLKTLETKYPIEIYVEGK